MTFRRFTVLEPAVAPAPLLVDSPHSGRIYPADFAYTCPLPLLRQTEDSYVDELVAGAAEAGATVVMAEFPRSYIDANRAPNDIDPAVLDGTWPVPLEPSDRTLLGLGLVRRMCKSNVPVYKGKLTIDEVQKRIDECYQPYHDALIKNVMQNVRHFGACYLINSHSMPSRGSDNIPYADFVLGDLCGVSCDPSFTRRVSDILQEMGYSVALNAPYKGREIVRRYGVPQRGQHALQLEINRRLYMNEQTLEKHEGFSRLQKNLALFFAKLATELMRDLSDKMAAE